MIQARREKKPTTVLTSSCKLRSRRSKETIARMTGYSFFVQRAMCTDYHQCFNVINISEFAHHLLAQCWACALNASKWYSFMRICHENNFKSHLSIFVRFQTLCCRWKSRHVIKSCNLQNGKTQMICMNSWCILFARMHFMFAKNSANSKWKLAEAANCHCRWSGEDAHKVLHA